MINNNPFQESCDASPKSSPSPYGEKIPHDDTFSPPLNISINQDGPKKNFIHHSQHSKPNSSSLLHSPLPIANRFGPLLKPNKSTSSSSSSLLGPLFPTGFEQEISPLTKLTHEKKRVRRIMKKKSKSKKALKSLPIPPPNPSCHSPLEISKISPDDVLHTASILNMSFPISPSLIQNEIAIILDLHAHDWTNGSNPL